MRTLEELAALESQDTGKPIKLARDSDMPFAADNWHFFAGAARHLAGTASVNTPAGIPVSFAVSQLASWPRSRRGIILS